MTTMRSRQQGLTLVELMVTLAVAIILIAVGMPLFSGLVGSNRATTQANSLVSALKLARSEAVKRADSVTVCADDGGACGGAGDWANGWLVHTDVNDSGGFDAGDVLRTWDPLAASSSVTVAGGAAVTFFATGAANNTFSFELDDSEASGSAADAAKRCVEVTATGQVRSKRWDPDLAWSCP
jgi:type IV fimbrial biogenesis protein FimT